MGRFINIVAKRNDCPYNIIGFDKILRQVNRRNLVSGNSICFDMEDECVWDPVEFKIIPYKEFHQKENKTFSDPSEYERQSKDE